MLCGLLIHVNTSQIPWMQRIQIPLRIPHTREQATTTETSPRLHHQLVAPTCCHQSTVRAPTQLTVGSISTNQWTTHCSLFYAPCHESISIADDMPSSSPAGSRWALFEQRLVSFSSRVLLVPNNFSFSDSDWFSQNPNSTQIHIRPEFESGWAITSHLD